MKKNLITQFAIMMFMAFTLFFTLTACSEDGEITPPPPPPPSGTVFSSNSNTTRTSADAEQHFYWENGDQIWIDEENDGTFNLRSSSSELSADKRTANFYIRQKVLTAPSYNLTYTGNRATTGKSVTITPTQTQSTWNDATHLGTSGDCGTSVATYNSETGNYNFTLLHRASYLIFMPYKSLNITDNWKLMKIEIIDSDGRALCGTYPFIHSSTLSTGGIDTGRASGTRSTITLNCTNGFPLPTSASDCCFAVIQPGTHSFTIRYTIKPTGLVNELPENEAVFTIDKTITARTYSPNGFTIIRHELSARSYSPYLHYMWDAVQPYWYGTEAQYVPKWYGASYSSYPSSNTDSRWYNPVKPGSPATQATRSCINMPNANAMTWYTMKGDPRWETNYPWFFEGDGGAHIYTYGAWFLKQQYISGFSTTVCYDGVTDARATEKTCINESASYKRGGRPSDAQLDKYFFLPTLGFVYAGVLNTSASGYAQSKISGAYWSSSPVPVDNEISYYMGFSQIGTGVGYSGRNRNYGRAVAPDWFQ